MKIFPVLIQYFDWKEGGTKTKVIEIQALENEQLETITSFVLNPLEKYGLSSKCVAHSGDNANVNVECLNRQDGRNLSTTAIERILKLLPTLKSYFLSQPPNLIKKIFEDEFSEICLWFLHALMTNLGRKSHGSFHKSWNIEGVSCGNHIPHHNLLHNCNGKILFLAEHQEQVALEWLWGGACHFQTSIPYR
ncbi:hypothetical protein PR048_002382 [Dryococelus australis]|uniref:Uncharacterized protein n=1 Tax=Dryococelus australis TaxID=614101 RepID=A0ABQ9IL25_9NEOP|nr:hypothetical protein PR048_002382 [Dryococelus australis]